MLGHEVRHEITIGNYSVVGIQRSVESRKAHLLTNSRPQRLAHIRTKLSFALVVTRYQGSHKLTSKRPNVQWRKKSYA